MPARGRFTYLTFSNHSNIPSVHRLQRVIRIPAHSFRGPSSLFTR